VSTTSFNQVRELAHSLTPEEKLALIGDLVQQLQGRAVTQEKKPFRSLWGALADLGPAPSAEEIDEARREAWANFPRDDF